LPDFLGQIMEIKDSHLLNALYRDYCFMTSAYLLEDCHLAYLKTRSFDVPAKDRLPAVLAKPLYYLANKLGAKPWLDYARSFITNNYTLINPEGEVVYDNMRAIRAFVGIPGEPGFILSHVAITAFAPKIITEI